MKYWTKYIYHEANIVGKRKKCDNNIYVFDIETTSYYILNNKIYPAINYKDLDEKTKKHCEFRSCMYEWTLSINDDVYYGRTWQEFIDFLIQIEMSVPEKKYIFIHNLAFEFQFLKSVLRFSSVTARVMHKPFIAVCKDFNIEFHCSYIMSNCGLEKLPKLFKLPVEKLSGELNYSKLRHSETRLSDNELKYCENDCLVVYYYILEELKTYERVDKIPTTSTGHVRRELKDLTRTDFKYKRIVGKSINVDPHIYNLLVEAFAGGYTHANWIYADKILHNVDSYDETSAYPYTLTAYTFPNNEFRKCNLKDIKYMSNNFAYLMLVEFKNIKCKYYNNFISASKCRLIEGAKYDNGRIMEAKRIIIVLTEVDFKFILDSYDCKFEILECYYSTKAFLPKQFINFVLEKYVNKTKYKDDPDYELEYQKEKNKFNALYGMSVTNMIRDEVIFNDLTKEWSEEELSNDEIIQRLNDEKKKAFLSFSYGVWVTAYARDNLLRRVLELDEHVVYCDTDSCKLVQGYDKSVFEKYNESVLNKLKQVSELLKIPYDNFAPTDIHGISHPLGLFENETKSGNIYTYDKFITQGAKKYASETNGEISITVAGVPKKSGSKALKKLEDFRDNFVFKYEDTGKNLLMYCENQAECLMTDYQGNEYIVNDKSGCCLVPTTYVLGKALEYTQLITSESSKRSVYKE